MSWLHTWSGLVLGWLLFAIFVTGALSYFRNEITFWMQPELHRANPDNINFTPALTILAHEAANARQWTLTLPGPRNPTLGLNWVAGDQNTRDQESGGRGQRPEASPDSRRGGGSSERGASRSDGQGWQGRQSGQGEYGASRANRPIGHDEIQDAVSGTAQVSVNEAPITELAQGRAETVSQNGRRSGGKREGSMEHGATGQSNWQDGQGGQGEYGAGRARRSAGRDEAQDATFGVAQARFNAESATKQPAQGRAADPALQNERRGSGRRGGESSPERGAGRSHEQDGQGERGVDRTNHATGRGETQSAAFGAAQARLTAEPAMALAQGRVEPALQSERRGDGGQGERGAGRASRSGGRDGTQDAVLGATRQAQGPAGAASQNERRSGGSRGPKILLDPESGERLEARKTAGGDFLYRFHFELYGVDRIWARWIVGVATLFMFIALITGVIIHRQIFKDFFTFRLGKGKRSWLDAHNLTGVLSLPFHLIITFSGLLLFGNMLIPTAMQSAYSGDTSAYMQTMRARMGVAQNPQPAGEAAPLVPLEPLIAAAEHTWGGKPVGTINIINPGDRNAIVELRQQTGASLTNGRSAAATLRFSGASGESLPTTTAAAPSVVQSISNVLMMLHRGFFATAVPRWLLFLSGIGGVLLIATGLIMWPIARGKQRDSSGRVPFGHRLVEVMNVAVIAGLPLAIAAYFWINRLTPVVWENRAEWEISVFFGVWALTIPYAILCEHKTAWVETLAAAGALFALLPIGNAITGGMSLFDSLASGRGLLAGFDLSVLLLGVCLLYTAYRIHRYVSPVGRHHLHPSVSADNTPQIMTKEQPA